MKPYANVGYRVSTRNAKLIGSRGNPSIDMGVRSMAFNPREADGVWTLYGSSLLKVVPKVPIRRGGPAPPSTRSVEDGGEDAIGLVDKGLTVTCEVHRSMRSQCHDTCSKLSASRAAVVSTNVRGKVHTLSSLANVGQVKFCITSTMPVETSARPPNPSSTEREVPGKRELPATIGVSFRLCRGLDGADPRHRQDWLA